MYTPQEVQDKKFSKAVFGGYDMREVDDFLDAVSADYSALYKENTVLKSKMKVLADKLEEYRSVDEAMRKALIVAQKMANEMTEDARAQSDEIRSKARADYENSIAALRDNIRNEERRLEGIREETKRFVETTAYSFAQQIESLKSMLTDAPAEPEIRRTLSLEDTAAEIERSIQSTFQAEMQHDRTEENAVTISPAEAGPAAAGPSVAAPEEAPAATDAAASRREGSEETFGEEEYAEVGIGGFSVRTEDNASADFAGEPVFPAADGKNESGKVREVNVGGMNIKVYEMELGGEKHNR